MDKPEELESNHRSCEQLAMLNLQSLTVNTQTATLAADLVLDLVTGNLKRFAVYFDQTSGSMTSRYTTQAAILQSFVDSC